MNITRSQEINNGITLAKAINTAMAGVFATMNNYELEAVSLNAEVQALLTKYMNKWEKELLREQLYV